MRLRRGHFLILPTLLLLLAACTRQAEGPFQPVGSDQSTTVASAASETPVSVVTQDTSGVVTDQVLPTDMIVTDTVPTDSIAITEFSPTEQTETAGNGTEEIAIFTLVPTETPTEETIPFDTASETPTTESGAVDTTGTSQFITPGSPNDLMGAPTGTPEPGATTDLLDTPTTMPEAAGTVEEGEGSATAVVDEDCLYTVVRGDSLFRIAIANDTTVAALRQANDSIRTTDVILPGQKLVIPECDITPTPTSSRTPFPDGVLTHTVKAGESLFVIAQKYDVTIDAIVQANNLTNPDRLQIGQVLVIPQP